MEQNFYYNDEATETPKEEEHKPERPPTCACKGMTECLC